MNEHLVQGCYASASCAAPRLEPRSSGPEFNSKFLHCIMQFYIVMILLYLTNAQACLDVKCCLLPAIWPDLPSLLVY
jgi:hypothetical protein